MSRLWAFLKMFPSNVVASLVFLVVLPWRKITHQREKVDYLLVLLSDNHWIFKLMSWTSKVDILGVTVGSFIFVKETHQSNKPLIHHEVIHVEQQERWPVIYFAIYLYYSWDARRRGQDPYSSNKFEAEAYARMNEV
jgi:hypothetical protein